MALRLLPAEFQELHQKIVLEYLQRGQEFSRKEWSQAVAACDLLKDTFEVEIQRDLAQSGIQFTAHDLRQRENRLTPYDIADTRFL